MKTDILLVWNEVPEIVKFFVLDEKSDIGKIAIKSAGKYINGCDVDDNDPIHQLYEMLVNYKGISSDQVAIGPFQKVVVCGFIM